MDQVGQLDANERAYELLKWQALAPLADYDEKFDYFSVWKESSDKALDQWDKEHPSPSSPELEAFRELERLGHYTQNDYYSPSKAANGFYTEQLRQRQARTSVSTDKTGITCRGPDLERERARLAPTHEEQGIRARYSRGRQRC